MVIIITEVISLILNRNNNNKNNHNYQNLHQNNSGNINDNIIKAKVIPLSPYILIIYRCK